MSRDESVRTAPSLAFDALVRIALVLVALPVWLSLGFLLRDTLAALLFSPIDGIDGVTVVTQSSSEPTLVSLGVGILGGLLLAFPWTAWQVCALVVPRVTGGRAGAWFVASVGLFVVGLLGGYFVMLPGWIELFRPAPGEIAMVLGLGTYVRMAAMAVLGSVAVSQLPVGVGLLALRPRR